jgi:GWxTD domain-containing protein
VSRPVLSRPALVVLGGLLAVSLASGAQPTRAQKIAALPVADRVWLTEFVAPIVQPEEEKIFLDLTEAYQREAFKEDFWQRRERDGLPPPLGPGYRFRYKERRDVLDQKYDGWQNDAGKIVLRWGEPDTIFKPRCGGEEVFRDVEVWTYGSMEFHGQPAHHHIFYRIAPSLPRRLWTVHDSNASVFYTNQCRRSFDQLVADCRGSPTERCGPCEDRCTVYNAWAEIVKRQGSPAGALMELAALLSYPKVSTEGLEKQKTRWATTTDSSAKTLAVTGPSGSVAVAPTAGVPGRTDTPAPAPTRTLPSVPSPTATPLPTLSATRSPTPPAAATFTPMPKATLTATAAPTPIPPAAPPPPLAPAPQAATRPSPSATATTRPTRAPSATPSATATAVASASPSPTRTPSPAPSATPPPTATRAPSPAPSRAPSAAPTPPPTRRPTAAAPSTPPPPPEGGGLRRLSATEIQERLDTLEPEYKEFVDLARPLMSDEELSRFLQLSGHDKDAFIRDFWKRHS